MDAGTAEVAAKATVNVLTGLVDMFKDRQALYWIITAYSLLVGFAMTFFGRRHFKKLLMLVGFFTAFLPLHYFTKSLGMSLVGGVVSGLLMLFFYPIFVFIIGMFPWAAILVAMGIDSPNLVLSLIGIGCGVVAVIYRKHIVIPVAAISGGTMLSFGLLFLLGGMNPYVFLALMVLLIAAGIFVQYRFTAKDLKDLPLAKETKEPTKESK